MFKSAQRLVKILNIFTMCLWGLTLHNTHRTHSDTVDIWCMIHTGYIISCICLRCSMQIIWHAKQNALKKLNRKTMLPIRSDDEQMMWYIMWPIQDMLLPKLNTMHPLWDLHRMRLYVPYPKIPEESRHECWWLLRSYINLPIFAQLCRWYGYAQISLVQHNPSIFFNPTQIMQDVQCSMYTVHSPFEINT